MEKAQQENDKVQQENLMAKGKRQRDRSTYESKTKGIYEIN